MFVYNKYIKQNQSSIFLNNSNLLHFIRYTINYNNRLSHRTWNNNILNILLCIIQNYRIFNFFEI
jgi:hypothetical protein